MRTMQLGGIEIGWGSDLALIWLGKEYEEGWQLVEKAWPFRRLP